MAAFAKYYVDFLANLFKNIWKFIKGIAFPFIDIFKSDIPGYFKELTESISSFGVIGWIAFILMTIINLALVFFVSYRIIQFLRRYILFRAKEVEKDELIEELARANEKISKLTIEKNQLYALKVNTLYPGMGPAMQQEDQQIEQGEKAAAPALTAPSRFGKLLLIDKKYENPMIYISAAENERMSLSEIINRFVNFAASQLRLYYDHKLVRYFFAGMATTKVLILEGISGTGKTSLPYGIAKFFNGSATIVSVQPSWRDRADLLGYLNEFTKTYNETDFLAAVYESSYRRDPTIVLLDEMNLARIEYYFAEFLSIMEMPNTAEWLVDLVPSGNENDPKHLIDGKILVPQNVWFVGTANQDDSTFTITDKVYDRTITVDINSKGQYFDAPVTESMNVPADYMEMLFQQAMTTFAMSEKQRNNIKEIDEFLLTKFKITFGNRIIKQINLFVPAYVACGGTEIEAIDFLLYSKIFRKLTGLNLAFLTKELGELILVLEKIFGKGKTPRSIDYIKLLKRTL